MENVAADAYATTLEIAKPIAQRQNVEQTLGRVLVSSIPGVDNVRFNAVGEELRRA